MVQKTLNSFYQIREIKGYRKSKMGGKREFGEILLCVTWVLLLYPNSRRDQLGLLQLNKKVSIETIKYVLHSGDSIARRPCGWSDSSLGNAAAQTGWRLLLEKLSNNDCGVLQPAITWHRVSRGLNVVQVREKNLPAMIWASEIRAFPQEANFNKQNLFITCHLPVPCPPPPHQA